MWVITRKKQMRYRILKFERYEDHLESLGYIPGVFVSKEQANLKIKTLSSDFEYTVEPIYEDAFYRRRKGLFNLLWVNYVRNVQVETTVSKMSTKVLLEGTTHKFSTLDSAINYLEGLGIQWVLKD